MISQRLLKWYDKFGRQDLPWRLAITPYRVWLSEIMLQQTQVKTVIDYFNRFIATFPTVINLANAPEDEVLHLWSGLGYYSRARNLHKAAKIVRDKYHGEFPNSVDELITLPGIGRSTAGAIVAIAFDLAAPILDGNVKRVLTRFLALNDWPGTAEMSKILWENAKKFTPNKRASDYTQAIMDIGATICTRSKPNCVNCPIQSDCQAHQLQLTDQLPIRKPKKSIPTKSTLMLLIKNQHNEILLEKRPPVGIWGGLWCLPVCDLAENIQSFCRKEFALEVNVLETLTSFRHTFSHYHLEIFPIILRVNNSVLQLREAKPLLWYNEKNSRNLGFAAPIKKLLENNIHE